MIQDKIESELNNDICEAVGCEAKVTSSVLVKAGDRSLALNLCNGCISKFEDTAEQHSTEL
jgi:hypothetical protein